VIPLTPNALDEHLKRVQASTNAHAVDLHLLHSALMMQNMKPIMVNEVILSEDLIKRATEECLQQRPEALILYKASAPNAQLLHGDMRALQRALAGLMAMMPEAFDSCDVIACVPEGASVAITLCDHPGMFQSLEDFVPIDAATNLIALSPVTRQRVIALSYALQVAYAHSGRLELKIWSEDALAVRFVLPQPV
jgi:hypothetical protein